MVSGRSNRPQSLEVTQILGQVAEGVPQADARLLQVVYEELKRLAAAKMRQQSPSHSLQPTALVHEAYVRLFGNQAAAPVFRDRAHFFAAATAAMRTILVDHARRKHAVKRGGRQSLMALPAELAQRAEPITDILWVHELLERLSQEHARVARTVEILVFGGLSVPEAAAVLGISDRTVKRDWRFGRAWLLNAMQEK